MVNVYLPYESNAAAVDEFSSDLAGLTAIIYQCDDHCFVLSLDFNVYFN